MECSASQYYYYVRYLSSNNIERVALFLFSNKKAGRDFGKAIVRFKSQDSKPIPNYRFPNSQGPQDTHGRDKNLNPYDNPPIEDWSIETNKKVKIGNVNCDSPVWKKSLGVINEKILLPLLAVLPYLMMLMQELIL